MLDQIADDVRLRLPELRARAGQVQAAAESMPEARDFRAALRAPGLSVIAEFKRASPSRGLMNTEMRPAAQAELYERGGAAALSVLTEPAHFKGAPADLVAARAAVSLPVLRKDFTLDPVQVWEARAMGADAVLLIVALLSDDELAELLDTSRQAGLAALVEVHDEPEARRAMAAGAGVVGVNNRDLTTFEVDLSTAERLSAILEADVLVAESGIHTPDDARRMEAAGYDAILVGEYLVRSADPAEAIAGLRGEAGPSPAEAS